MDDFEPQGGDPLHKSGQGGGIWEFGTEGRRGRAYSDLAIVEFCAQYGVRPAGESDLIHVRSHQVAPWSAGPRTASILGGAWLVVILSRMIWPAPLLWLR